MGKRYKDFDAAWAERKKEPVETKVLGKVYTLPSTLPAAIMLYTLRSRENGEGEINAEAVFKMAEALYGREGLEEIMAKGLDTEQLGDLIKGTIELYTGGSEEETPTPAPVKEATGA